MRTCLAFVVAMLLLSFPVHQTSRENRPLGLSALSPQVFVDITPPASTYPITVEMSKTPLAQSTALISQSPAVSDMPPEEEVLDPGPALELMSLDSASHRAHCAERERLEACAESSRHEQWLNEKIHRLATSGLTVTEEEISFLATRQEQNARARYMCGAYPVPPPRHLPSPPPSGLVRHLSRWLPEAVPVLMPGPAFRWKQEDDMAFHPDPLLKNVDCSKDPLGF